LPEVLAHPLLDQPDFVVDVLGRVVLGAVLDLVEVLVDVGGRGVGTVGRDPARRHPDEDAGVAAATG
jgi:hypothetical protein